MVGGRDVTTFPHRCYTVCGKQSMPSQFAAVPVVCVSPTTKHYADTGKCQSRTRKKQVISIVSNTDRQHKTGAYL